MLQEKYINPFTDFGFKRLFGEEFSKDLLKDFLNALLEEQGEVIQSLSYMKNEQLGRSELDRRAIFDLYCENQHGEKFIVELQKSKQNFFKDRSIFYSTFPIQEQAVKGDWSFELKSVYTIGILDFIFEEDKNEPQKFRYDIKLTDQETHKVFYDKLTYIYLEMPKFKKSESELETNFDKWLYFIKNLNRLEEIPLRLQNHIFEQAFKIAEIAKMDPKQYQAYEDSLKYYRDLKNSLDTAFDDGVETGIEKTKKELKPIIEEAFRQKEEERRQKEEERRQKIVAIRLLSESGIPISVIAQNMGLSESDVTELLKNQS